MALGVVDAPTFLYTRLKYGSPSITRQFREAAVNLLTPMLGERGERRTSGGHTEYLFNRIEDTVRVDMLCEPVELDQLRWFFEDWGTRGKQFEFWINRLDGSCWLFNDTLRDQNRLVWTRASGATSTYADTTNGRGYVHAGANDRLSVLLAQASASTITGYDDPLNKDEGVVVIDFKPTWAGSDSTLHVILDTTGPSNRLQVRKTATNTLVIEITDNASAVKSMAGSVTWSANDRVQLVGSWTTGGVLALNYAVNGGTFTALTTGAGAGTGLITTLPTTLYLGGDNAGANLALATYDEVKFFKKAFSTPTRVLPDYRPVWKNYFGYAELQAAWQPQRVTPSRPIWSWPFMFRNGVAA